MMRWFIRCLLSLSFLLLRGYVHLYAHTTHTGNNTVAQQIIAPSLPHHFSQLHNRKGLVNEAGAPGSRKISDRLKATEIEDDDDTLSLRKYAEISPYFIAYLHAYVLNFFHCCKQKRLPFCEHFSYAASGKCILYRVIRI